MSSHAPILPDPLPLREALRGLRHVLRRSGQSLADTLAVEALPKPAAQVATRVLREAGDLARSLDTVASDIAKTVLGGGPVETVHLTGTAEPADLAAPFARSVYVALNAVLPRLGIRTAFVSEVAAREAYGTIRSRAFDGAAPLAAALLLELLAVRVIRDIPVPQTGAPGAGPEVVALFAVLLWQQSDWSDEDGEQALDAAADIAIAVRDEVLAASAARDADRLAALFGKYASHV